MNRRSMFGIVMAAIAAICGWKFKPKPIRLINGVCGIPMHPWSTLVPFHGKAMHSCPQGGKVDVALYHNGKPTGAIQIGAYASFTVMPGKMVGGWLANRPGGNAVISCGEC